MAKNYIVVNNVNVEKWMANNAPLTAIYANNTKIWELSTIFYENGVMNIPFAVGVNYNNAGSVSNSGSYLQVTTREDTSIMSTNTVNLTDYTRLEFNISYYARSASPSYYAILIGTGRNNRVYNGAWTIKQTGTTTGVVSVDVSSLNGNYYIGLGVINGTVRTTSIIGIK